jgi:hypothetical protein
MDFTGTWDVVSNPDFDYGYLREEGPPYVTPKKRSRVEARYEIGVRAGHLDGAGPKPRICTICGLHPLPWQAPIRESWG